MPNTEAIFINRPQPKAHDFPWVPPPTASNPVVRGLPLYYGAILVSNSSWLAQQLWQNAGFGKLRDREELHGVEPRYDPLVIRSAGVAKTNSNDHLKALLAEDWDTKRPSSKNHWSILDYHKAYLSGKLTPTAVAKALLPLIRKDVPKPTKHATAFMQTREDLALKAAEESTKRYASGKPLSLLDGVPVVVKDEVDVAGYKKCYGSKLDFTSKDDVTSYCVQLWQDAGAVLMAKTLMHELGSEITNNNPNYGTPLNPNNENYYCGGSSGGSAYAVASGLFPLAEGNDGGGSIRIPSNYCGIFGLKTTHGRVGKRPSYELVKSTAVAGPMAANMCDLEIGYRLMAQPDALHPDGSLFMAPEPVSLSMSKKKTLGIPREWFNHADPVVRSSCQKAVDYLVESRGYNVVDISIPLTHEGQLAHALSILGEMATAVKTSDIYKLTAPAKIIISAARQTTALDFLQAQRLRNLVMEHLAHLFDKYPGLIIVTPTTPEAGWRIEKGDLAYGASNANKQLRNMEYVWLANFSGCPCLNAPIGFAEPDEVVKGTGKIPIGLMGMGEWCSDDDLIAFGYDCEKYLNETLEGGRPRPGNWTDVFEISGFSQTS